MISLIRFTKREAVNLRHQGPGIFEYEKILIRKDGRDMCALTLGEATELRDALIKEIPRGLFLKDFIT